MKTPNFWNSHNFYSYILIPFSIIYATISYIRIYFGKNSTVNIPVICIGNLTAGGTGKTPVSISIAQLLIKLGYKPNFISRGYGGTINNEIVDAQKHSVKQTGDEPMLLSSVAPVSINSNRYKAAIKAIENQADILIMDDGFQNPSLHKDLSFLVFDGESGVGNGLPIPSGPLREFFNLGAKRANAVIIIGQDKHNIAQKFTNLPIFNASITSKSPILHKNNVIAFAGIGRPEKFYNSLVEHKIYPIKTINFSDHHFYSTKELNDLISMAKKYDAELITTTKDFVKIPKELQKEFTTLDISIKWQNESKLKTFILENINKKKL